VSIFIVDVVSEYSRSQYFMVMLVNLVFIILGMGLEAPAMIFGFLPSFIPLLERGGVDLVQFGAIFAINMGIGMLVPPVALNLFVSTQLAGVRYGEAVYASWPFILIMVIDLMLVAWFPGIALFLPNLLFGRVIG
jgi:C4-dicarboxylate transporter, DctM subunit